MTDAELSRAIAEFLEPEPTWPHVGQDSVWFRRHGHWEPCDMLDDSSMTILLLQKLMQHRTESGHVLFLNDGRFSIDGSSPQQPEDFQREVAITFARAHGLWKD